jgi:hypothetical protein
VTYLHPASWQRHVSGPGQHYCASQNDDLRADWMVTQNRVLVLILFAMKSQAWPRSQRRAPTASGPVTVLCSSGFSLIVGYHPCSFLVCPKHFNRHFLPVMILGTISRVWWTNDPWYIRSFSQVYCSFEYKERNTIHSIAVSNQTSSEHFSSQLLLRGIQRTRTMDFFTFMSSLPTEQAVDSGEIRPVNYDSTSTGPVGISCVVC